MYNMRLLCSMETERNGELFLFQRGVHDFFSLVLLFEDGASKFLD
jgi:hypothetical protein